MTFRDELTNLIPPQPSTEVDVKRAHESYEAIKEAFRAMAREGKYHYEVNALVLYYIYEVPYPYVQKGEHPWDYIIDMDAPNFRTYRDTLQALLRNDSVTATAVMLDTATQKNHAITDKGPLGLIQGEGKLCMECTIRLSERMVRRETSTPGVPFASAGMSGNTPVTTHAETAAAQRSIQDELNSLLPS